MVVAEHNKTNSFMRTPLRVLQITDTHLFGDEDGRLAGMDTDASLLEVIEYVLADFLPADLILATGDIAHEGYEQAYARFKQNFERLQVPTLVIPGNHDEPVILRRAMQGGLVQSRNHLVLGNWLFIMLDSTVPKQSGGHLDAAELELLERLLQDHPDHHTMICLHHHPVSMRSEWIDSIGVANSDDFFATTDRFPQVRCIVWGHVHQAFSAVRKGVQLYASPSTCIQFKPKQQNFALDDLPPGFRWFDLYANGDIATEVVRMPVRSREVDLEISGYG